jgi:methyltransferase
MILSIVILGLVTAQRLGELVVARRNTRRLRAEGGIERGAEHYPLMVGLHAAWLAGLWWFAWDRPANLAWLAAYLLLEVLRVWVLASIGRRWTTRIIVVPGEALVRKGPYRFIGHPNYAVVAGEIAVLPLVFGLPAYAAVFTVLNAFMLWLRIRTEDAALGKGAMNESPT